MKWVVCLALVLFFWSLGGHDLWAPDESYFGEGAREMVVDGAWLVPHVDGEITTDKPPLFFWLIALLSLPFGSVTSLTARLPSALAALGTLVLVMRLCQRTSDRRAAILAGVMLVTTHMFWDKARWSQIDALLSFLMIVALTAFASFRDQRMAGRRAGLIFWAACALGVLAKGPIGVLVPLGIALATLAADRDLGRWRRFAPAAGPALFVGLLAPWLLAVMLWGGDYSVWGALQEHFVDRARRGMHHLQPFWYYAKVVPYALLPWSFLLPGAVLLAWRRRRQADDRFLLVWAVFVILLFSISREKRDLYILPAVPPLILMSARLVAALRGWWPATIGLRGAHLGTKWVTVPQGALGAVLVAGGAFVALAARRYDPSLGTAGVVLGTVMIAGGGWVTATALAGKTLRTVQASAATMAAAMLATVSFVYPALEPAKSGRVLAAAVRDATAGARAAGRPVLSLGLGNVTRSISFYADGLYVEKVATVAELLARVPDAYEGFAVVDQASFERTPATFRDRCEILYATRLSRRDIRLLRIAPSGSAAGSAAGRLDAGAGAVDGSATRDAP